MPVPDLPRRHPDLWRRATRHPFLSGVGDGTVQEAAFDTWLMQDFHFVTDLLRFQARLLARAPRPAQAVLAGGCVALTEEFIWFEELAATRRLCLDVPRLPATAAYASLLDRLDAADPGVALTALWVIERVYLDAWSYAAPGAPAYREFVEHWTTPEFGAYVEALRRVVGDAAPPGPDAPVTEDGAVAVAVEILEAECAFWDMAVTGSRSTAGGRPT